MKLRDPLPRRDLRRAGLTAHEAVGQWLATTAELGTPDNPWNHAHGRWFTAREVREGLDCRWARVTIAAVLNGLIVQTGEQGLNSHYESPETAPFVFGVRWYYLRSLPAQWACYPLHGSLL